MFRRNEAGDTQTMKTLDVEDDASMTDSQIVNLRDAPAPSPQASPTASAAPSAPATQDASFTQAANSEGTSVVGRTLYFKGELTVSEDLVIEGTVEGSIKQDKASLTVMPNGRVIADVQATCIFVEGNVKGDLHATESIKLRSGGEVEGNLVAPSISIDGGATFNGSVEMRAPK